MEIIVYGSKIFYPPFGSSYRFLSALFADMIRGDLYEVPGWDPEEVYRASLKGFTVAFHTAIPILVDTPWGVRAFPRFKEKVVWSVYVPIAPIHPDLPSPAIFVLEDRELLLASFPLRKRKKWIHYLARILGQRKLEEILNLSPETIHGFRSSSPSGGS
jgi:hypothetical protein